MQNQTNGNATANGTATVRRVLAATLTCMLAAPSYALADCAPVPADILHWWPGDGNADDIAGGIDGVVTAPATFSPGLVGQGFDFSAGGVVQMPFATTFNITTPGITVELWVKSSAVAGDHTVVDKSHGGGTDSTGWTLQANGGTIGACVGGGMFAGDFACADSGATTPLDGTFHHIAYSWSDTDDTVRFYVDGVETETAIQDAPANNVRDLLFGRWWFGGRQYNGMIDEVSLYGRALAPSEIAAIAAAGVDGKCDLCGDGAVEATETCDPTAAGGECCNLSCDNYLGDGASCDDGDACTGGDSCLAGACTEYDDLPCCGDGVVQPVEACDPEAVGGECCLPSCFDFAADDAPCDDGDACTGPDTCQATVCSSGPLDCDDGNACTQDSCSDGCVNDPSPLPDVSCKTGLKASLSIKDDDDDSKDQLKWKLGSAQEVSQLDLGLPDTTDDYALCVYDRSAGVPSIAARIDVPAGSLWISKAPKGFQYVDSALTQDGVKKVLLKTGAAGKSSMQLQARGATLPTPVPVSPTMTFTQGPSVTVQLVATSGFCATSTFTPAQTKTNDGVKFQAKVVP